MSSFAEFYVENGIDPNDPDGYKNYTANAASQEYDSGPTGFVGFAVVEEPRMALDEHDLDNLAGHYGWFKLDCSGSNAPHGVVPPRRLPFELLAFHRHSGIIFGTP